MKVAIVHDWLTGMRGGERCLEVFCELFPDATLFTLFHFKGSVSPTIEGMAIRTSFLQRFPGLERRYRYYLPLFPLAVERFDLRDFDLVLSSSHCVAKGVRPREGAFHLCYIHAPMRYVWDRYRDYAGRAGRLTRWGLGLAAPFLRRWDVASSRRVHRFIANSRHVAEQVRRLYGQKAEVVYPPVETKRFYLSPEQDDYYLSVSALVPYKAVDLAIEAFNRLKRPLWIVGSGPDERRLRKIAGPTIRFLGRVPYEELPAYYARCRALIFPGVEDFGIAPLEAMASGRPVIALGEGGALESVVPADDPDGRPPTGLFFEPQTAAALVEAVRRFESGAVQFDPPALRRHAEGFDRAIFKEKMRNLIQDLIKSPLAPLCQRGERGD
ncbi:MAG: glycosyltransferase [Nitrospirae bacterium]|nr:glycosyltransferase [Nitrospirota bacterium]